MADAFAREICSKGDKQKPYGFLMPKPRRRRHEQLAVHELVPRRVERVLIDQLANLAGGPFSDDCGHGHNLLGAPEISQPIMPPCGSGSRDYASPFQCRENPSRAVA